MNMSENTFIIKTTDELTMDDYRQVVMFIKSSKDWVKFFKPIKTADRNFRKILASYNFNFKFEENGNFLYMVYKK